MVESNSQEAVNIEEVQIGLTDVMTGDKNKGRFLGKLLVVQELMEANESPNK